MIDRIVGKWGYLLRRRDREIKEFDSILEIIKKCDVCSVAFYDDEYPYVIPLNFGFLKKEEELTLYFHGAKNGKKIDLLKKNNKVAFEMNCSHKLILGNRACDATMEYESVCGNGSMQHVSGEEKELALNLLMRQYTGQEKHEFDEKEVNAVMILKIEVHEIHGKAIKY